MDVKWWYSNQSKGKWHFTSIKKAHHVDALNGAGVRILPLGFNTDSTECDFVP